MTAHQRPWRTAALAALALAASLAAPAGAKPGDVERLDPRLDALLPKDAVLETVIENQDWTEGPLWDRRSATLLFSDVPRNAIYRWSASTGAVRFLFPSGYTGSARFTGPEPGSNGLAFDPQGRLVICQHGDRRVVRREPDGTFTTLAGRFMGKRLNSPNDLVFRRNGELWFTDPPFGLPRTFDDPEKEVFFQGVYRVTPDRKLFIATREVAAPNGIGFSPDERTLYVSNAQAGDPIWLAFPVRPDGSLGPGRTFAEARAWVRDGEGVPDGLKVDVHGNLFAAGPGGVHVFAPDGTRLGRIETGVPTGNVAFGGQDGSALYVAANKAILRIQTTTRGLGFQ